MTVKEAAWLGRRDLEALARMSDYDLSTVLDPQPNVSRRKVDKWAIAGVVAVILAVLILL